MATAATLRAWLDIVELEGIRFDELTVKRLGRGTDASKNSENDSAGASHEEKKNAELSAMSGFRKDRKKFRVVVRLRYTDHKASYGVQLACYYTVHKDLELPEQVGTEFVERTALPTCIPYLREALSSLASRIGAPQPVLQEDLVLSGPGDDSADEDPATHRRSGRPRGTDRVQ